MAKHLAVWTAAIAVLASGGALRAHHSISMFELGSPIWVKGTVVRYEPINPHAMFTVDERKPDGQVQRWTVEGPSLNRLSRMGAGENFLNAGDVVEVCGFAPKSEFVGESSTDIRRYPPDRRIVHGHLLLMPDGRMRPFGSYGKLDNCIRAGDQPRVWVEFLTREPLAWAAWCASTRIIVKVASTAPKGFVDEVNKQMTTPCN